MPARHNRHVRFAPENTFHSPPTTPLMPPLTFSSSTVPSSLGPPTPPSPYQLLMPTSSIPAGIAKRSISLPGPSNIHRPHPHLDMAGIVWDLRDHASTISNYHQTVSSHTWTEPAVTPPQPFITITIFNFPWKFIVHASTRSYITFEDVVETIYRTLRMNITEPEFYAAGSSNDQRRASRAYESRYRRQINTKVYEEEKRGGMKRVDFLMERTRFASLSNRGAPDEWEVNVT